MYEKRGWTADAYLIAETRCNYGTQSFWEK
jgi:hypothetical protein